MTASLMGWLVKLLTGSRSTRVAQVVGISFLEHTLRLVHCGEVVDLSLLRAGVLREEDAELRIKEAEATAKEAEADAKRAAALQIAAAAEKERIEAKRAEIQLEEAALRVAEKQGDLAAKQARQKLEQAKAERIHAAEGVLLEKLSNLRMKGGSLSVEPAELKALIEKLRSSRPLILKKTTKARGRDKDNPANIYELSDDGTVKKRSSGPRDAAPDSNEDREAEEKAGDQP